MSSFIFSKADPGLKFDTHPLDNKASIAVRWTTLVAYFFYNTAKKHCLKSAVTIFSHVLISWSRECDLYSAAWGILVPWWEVCSLFGMQYFFTAHCGSLLLHYFPAKSNKTIHWQKQLKWLSNCSRRTNRWDKQTKPTFFFPFFFYIWMPLVWTSSSSRTVKNEHTVGRVG